MHSKTIYFTQFRQNCSTEEAGYKTLLLAVYKTSLFFEGSEVAGYKTLRRFRARSYNQPPVCFLMHTVSRDRKARTEYCKE